MTPDEKIEWLITAGWLVDLAVRPEAFELIREVYPRTGEESRQRLLRAIKDSFGTNDEELDSQEHRDRDAYDWFDVLLDADPRCDLAKSEIQRLQDQYPDWVSDDLKGVLLRVSRGFYVRPVSPWSIEGMLSRPGAEWVDEALGYEPQQWGETIDGEVMEEKRPAQGVREAATKCTDWGIDFADELMSREEWRREFWQELIGAWQECQLTLDQLRAVLSYMHIPALIDMHSNSIMHFLYSLVDQGGKPNVIEVLPYAKDVALTIWDGSENEIPRILSATDWLTDALNSNAGMVVRFWLSAIWVQSEQGTKRDGELPEDDVSFFDLVVGDSGRRGKLGQTMMTSRLSYLLSFDYEWTTDQLLPLFDPDHSSFEPAWHGFTWSQLRSDVGSLMVPKFLAAATVIDRISRVGVPERRDVFVRQYALLAVYEVDDPILEWIPTLYSNGDSRDCHMFTWEIGRILENMADAQKVELWNRWLMQYWQNRLSGIPKPLEQKEVQELLRWPKDLAIVFPDAVSLAIRMPPTSVGHWRVGKDILNTELAEEYPSECAQLLEFVDGAETDWWNWYEINSVIDVLIEAPLEDSLLGKIEDIRARRGSET